MVVVKSDEKREYASVEFLKWFTDAQRNLQFSTESGYLPVKKEANSLKALGSRRAKRRWGSAGKDLNRSHRRGERLYPLYQ